jgi:hypothetical protein
MDYLACLKKEGDGAGNLWVALCSPDYNRSWLPVISAKGHSATLVRRSGVSVLGAIPDIRCPLERTPLKAAADYPDGRCGRVIQSSQPIRLAIVEGLDVTDSRKFTTRPEPACNVRARHIVRSREGLCAMRLLQ